MSRWEAVEGLVEVSVVKAIHQELKVRQVYALCPLSGEAKPKTPSLW